MNENELQEIADTYGLYTEQDVKNRVSCELLGIGTRNEELEKENAELKKEVELWKKASENNSYKAFQLQKENKELLKDRDRWSKDKKQLTKAIEIITSLLNVFVYDLADDEMDTGDIDAKIKAEQFLQEVEK